MKLQNKIAVITGGSQGIGFAIADEFIREGAKVVIFSRNQQHLTAAAKKLGKNCYPIKGDISKISDLEELYQQVAKIGKIDILVANASLYRMIPVAEVTEEFFDTMMNINLKGTYFTVQRALPYFSNHASIILISADAAQYGIPNISVYAAAKAAIAQLARSFAVELLDRNIRVNSISPGLVKTEFVEAVGWDEQQLQRFAQQTVPMKRAGIPIEIAKAAVFLASTDSSYITATNLLVDGGKTGIR